MSAAPTTTLERIKSDRQDRARLSRRCGADVVPRCVGTARGLRRRAMQTGGRRDDQTRFRRSPLAVEWVAVGPGFDDVADHRVDMICANDEVTLVNREKASFSIPIFPGGVSALVRANASEALIRDLQDRPQPYEPLWRGTPPPTLSEPYVLGAGRLGDDGGAAGSHRRAPTDREHRARRELRRRRRVDPEAEFGRAVRRSRETAGSGAAQREREDLRVLTRHFTFVALALALPRNDDDFRLASIGGCPMSTRTRSSARCTRRYSDRPMTTPSHSSEPSACRSPRRSDPTK